MKKILLAFLSVGFVFLANAQADCDPSLADGYSTAFYPDTVTNFNSGCIGEPYEQLIYFKVPTDTTIDFNGTNVNVDIIQIKLNSIDGLPNGLSIETNPANGIFPGGSNGCGVISGTPTAAGDYTITINVTSSVDLFGGTQIDQDDSFSGYHIVISDCSSSDIEKIELTESFVIFPNPAQNNVTIGNLRNDGTTKNIDVVNIEGKVVQSIKTIENNVTFSVADLDAGIYFVKVLQNGTQNVSKLIIE
ncbi:MAG: T9SS type A sorting domain-containing protein [Brumimicrobium sp.]